MGIEPTTSAWKAEVLPLNYTRKRQLRENVGKTGLEPAAPWSQTMCSTKLSYFPFIILLLYCVCEASELIFDF